MCSSRKKTQLLWSFVQAFLLTISDGISREDKEIPPRALMRLEKVEKAPGDSSRHNGWMPSGALGEASRATSSELVGRSVAGTELVLARESPQAKTKQRKHAVATIMCQKVWTPAALTFASSLKRHNATADLVVIVPEDLDPEIHDLLADYYDKVYFEKYIKPHPSVTRAGGDCVTLQLWAWSLPYKKVLYADMDIVFFESPDPIFKHGELTAKQDKEAAVMASTVGKGQHPWNGGMFLLQPNPTTFSTLDTDIRTYKKDDPHIGIQQYLNHKFPPCKKKPQNDTTVIGCWKHELDAGHNVFTRTLPAADLDSLPSKLGKTIKSLHYSGMWDNNHKPWEKLCMVHSDVIGYHFKTEYKRTILKPWFEEYISAKATLHPDKAHLVNVTCPCSLADKTLECAADAETLKAQ